MATPLSLRLPEECPACEGRGAIQPEHTISARQVALNWSCRRCGHSWPITNAERDLREQRSDALERRVRSGQDRRRVKQPN